MNDINKIVKIACESCQMITDHKIIREYIEHNEENTDIEWCINYYIAKCNNCGDVKFVSISSNSEDCESVYDNEIGWHLEYIETIKIYPPSKIKYGQLKNYYSIPERIRKIYLQTTNSIANKDYILAATGLRMIIEAFCLEKNVKIVYENNKTSNLENMIDSLREKQIISKKQCDALHGIRFLGNLTTHDVISANEEQIMIGIEIIENIVKTEYCDDDLRRNFRLPFKSYNEFESFVLFKIKNMNTGEVLNINDIWKNEEDRYNDSERLQEYGTYKPKIIKDLKDSIDKGNYYFGDLDNKYNKKYRIIHETIKGDFIIKKIPIT